VDHSAGVDAVMKRKISKPLPRLEQPIIQTVALTYHGSHAWKICFEVKYDELIASDVFK
jgi:hypothetical protein